MRLQAKIYNKVQRIRERPNIRLFQGYLENSNLTPSRMKKYLILRRFKDSALKSFIDEVAYNFPFTVSYRIRDFQSKKQSVQFAYSEVFVKKSTYFAFRELSRTANNPWEETKIIYGKNFIRKKIFTIPCGEDPRLFFYKQEPWLYIQIYNESERDVEIRVRNLVNGVEYKLHSPLDFNGKNWVPFEKNDELHFIYSLEPLVVLKMSFDKQGIPGLQQVLSPTRFRPSWGINFANSIGRIRGGTPGINFEENILGFTHKVHDAPNYQFHTLGLFTLNLNDFELKLVEISKLSPGFLIDPYGVAFSKRRMLLFCSVVEGDLHSLNSNVANIVFSFKQNTLRNWISKLNSNLD